MLAFLAGELTNSAKYFSTFANVSTDTYQNFRGTFRSGSSDTWRPWKYSECLTVVLGECLITGSLGKTLDFFFTTLCS